jgi:hypothetical protein
MSSGSCNSNLGYGKNNPYIGDSNHINKTSSNTALFTDNQLPGKPYLKNGGEYGISDNVKAANASKGGKKKRKMRKTKKSRKHKWTRKTKKYKKSKKGGYSQYQNNVPYTPSYSVGTTLNEKDSSLANPPPIIKTNHCNK